MRLRCGASCHSTNAAGTNANATTAAETQNSTAQAERSTARWTNAVARGRKEALLRDALAELLAGNSEFGADDICKRYINILFHKLCIYSLTLVIRNSLKYNDI